MALCPTVANPPATITEGLRLFSTWGEDDDLPGDYAAAGIGTRNFGTGIVRIKNIPANTSIVEAWLAFNTYQSNNQPAPSVTIKRGTGAATPVTAGTIYGISGSTCWFNPGGEATTYLRNRVYLSNVTATVTGNGNYTLAGLPVDLAMPIGADGDRLPGCQCSQGAVIFVIWMWNDDAGPANNNLRLRGVNAYVGSKLLSPSSFWGGSITYNLPFRPVQSTVDMNFFKGDSNITAAAGDTQQSIPGDSFAINQVRFVPPNNTWTKINPSLSVKKYSVAQIYDGDNSAFAATTNDCINLFLLMVSGNKTQPKAQFQIVSCAATALDKEALPEDTEITVFSNYVHPDQARPGGPCRAQAYNQPDVGPPAPNPPGLFPAAPYYISVDKEIMKVTAKAGEGPNGIPPGAPDPNIWTVQRGQNGTTAADHPAGTCVYLLAPPKFIKDMMAGLAQSGQAPQRPSAGRPTGRRKK